MRREEWLNGDIKKFSKKQCYKKIEIISLRPPRLCVCFFICVALFVCGRRLLQVLFSVASVSVFLISIFAELMKESFLLFLALLQMANYIYSPVNSRTRRSVSPVSCISKILGCASRLLGLCKTFINVPSKVVNSIP